MIYEERYKVKISDINSKNEATNKFLLTALEDVACSHATAVEKGEAHAREHGLVWVILNWKLKVLKRPLYLEDIIVKTWLHDTEKLITYRDFEIYNNQGEVLACATSRWCMMNLETRRLVKIEDKYIKVYEPEGGKKVFEEDIKKIKEDKEYTNIMKYTVRHSDIDINKHMHNLNYLDLAYDTLPSNVRLENDFDNVLIEYRKEMKEGEEATCYYNKKDNQHVVTIKTEDKENALIMLY